MPVENLAKAGLVALVACRCHTSGAEQLVGDAPESGHDYDDFFVTGFDYLLDIQNALHGTYGCSAEFHYFHFCRIVSDFGGQRYENVLIRLVFP